MTQKTVCLLAALGAAGIFTAARGDYVTLTTGDEQNGTKSFSDAGHWSDGAKPSSGKDYLVALGGDDCGSEADIQALWTANFGSGTTKTFAGGSLTLGELGENGKGGVFVYQASKAGIVVNFNALHLNRGCYWLNSGASTMGLSGPISVYSPTNDPFSFIGTEKLKTLTVSSSISGAEGTCLQVRSSAFVPASNGMTELVFSGDNRGYYGQFRAKNPKNRLKFTGYTSIGSSAMCSVALAEGGILVCDNDSASYDTSKKIWVEETGGCLETPEGSNGTLAMTIGGDAPVRKVGAGKLTFTGALDGTSMWVTDGELVLTDETTLVNGADVVVLDGGILTGSPTPLYALPVVVKTGGLLAAAFDTDRVTLSAAEFEARGGIMARINPAGDDSSVVTLTGTCTVAWPLALAIDQAYPATGGAESYPVVRIPTLLKTVTKEDFVLTGIALSSADPVLGVSVQLDQEGLQVVSVYRKGAPVTSVVGKTAVGNTFANGAVWSDERPAHSGADYLVWADTVERDVRTSDDDSAPITFPGESLTLTGTGSDNLMARLHCFATSLTINDLRLNEHSALFFNTEIDAAVYRVYGKITIAGSADYPARFLSARNTTVAMHARLVGDSGSKLLIAPATSNNGVRHYDFLADNSGYLGCIEVSQSGGGTPAYTKYMELRIGDETNLGGDPPEFNYSALTLTSYGCLSASQSLTIDDSNRGIFVSGSGQMSVGAGDEMTILSDLTIYGGTLYKRGAGTLKLGGTMRYGKSGTATSPGNQASKAIIEVREGALQPTKGAICSQVQLKVANAGCLRIAPQSEEADEVLKTKGLVVTEFTDGRDHIVPADEGGKINIDLVFDDSAPELRNATVQVPLLTVPESVANQIRGSIALTYTPTQLHHVSLMERVVSEGVQFYAEYKGGFLFIIR